MSSNEPLKSNDPNSMPLLGKFSHFQTPQIQSLESKACVENDFRDVQSCTILLPIEVITAGWYYFNR